MNRRDWMKSAAASPALLVAQAPRKDHAVEHEIVRLKTKHTWTTTMSSSDFRDVLYVRYVGSGLTGHGEGAPIVRYHESAKTAAEAVQAVAPMLLASEPWKYRKILSDIFAKLPGEWAAKSAIDIALHDWVAQKLGVPLYRYFGLDAADAPVTTFSIGIDTPEITKQKVLEAEPYPILKIKVGLEKDEATLEAVRSVTKKPLRLDANEGFKSKEEAIRKINWLEGLGAQFIEQPLPAQMLEEQKWVRSKVHLPIFADESCLRAEDIPKIAGAYDGVVIKLDKTGGLLGAMQMIHTAKSHGLKTMLGCMVSSSVTITAAAHLSPMVDFADLDGNLLIANDPFSGVRVQQGKLVLPSGPGLGLTKAA